MPVDAERTHDSLYLAAIRCPKSSGLPKALKLHVAPAKPKVDELLEPSVDRRDSRLEQQCPNYGGYPSYFEIAQSEGMP